MAHDREEARQRKRAAARARYRADTDHRRRALARSAEWVRQNRQRVRDYTKQYANQNRARAKESSKKWSKTTKGKASKARSNAKFIRIGETYAGYAGTAEQAKAINAHIRDRVAGFTAKQRAAAETVTNCPVAEQPELSLAWVVKKTDGA